MENLDRRTFLASGAAGLSAIATGCATTAATSKDRGAMAASPPKQPVVISSYNGMPAVNRAMDLLLQGADCIDAVVEGISIVENDPEDMTVGYGGLPNEEGVVELDACVMHGPSHKAGAVAALQGIRHPSKVALLVLRRTNHVMLVGENAQRFALSHGFETENLLTDRARQAWERWKANENRRTDWLDDEEQGDLDIVPLRQGAVSGTEEQYRGASTGYRGVLLGTRYPVLPPNADDIPYTTGTIHCAAVDTNGDLGACTSTSGLSYKIAGRVGDSPIIGAGNFVDNLVGAAGATGRGESVIKSCGAFQVVNHMANGAEPTEACLKTLKWIADHTRRNRLRNERGEPNFQVTFYALRRDGAFGSASLRKGGLFTVHDGTQAKAMQSAYLYE